MDPCDDDDTAASTADVLPVSLMEWLQLCYSDVDAFLHVDPFHPHTANHRPLELYLHVDVTLPHTVRRKRAVLHHIDHCSNNKTTPNPRNQNQSTEGKSKESKGVSNAFTLLQLLPKQYFNLTW